jgi:putative DNA primase/helicase
MRWDAGVLFHGPGGTGKNTLLDSSRKAVGDYGEVTSFDMFVAKSGDEKHPTELARLRGARLVSADEGPKKRDLDAEKFKMLSSGGTPVPARFMRQDFFTFKPQMKITLSANNWIRVHSEDSGAWRRLMAVPFTYKPDVPDENLRSYLQTNDGAQQAMLAWLVQGAIEVLAMLDAGKKVPVPECVIAATEEWRRDSDRVGAWLEDECELDPAAWTPSKELQESINDWWKVYVSNSETWKAPSLMASLGDEMKMRGCYAEKNEEDVRGWRGVRLKRATPRILAANWGAGE